MEAFVIRVVIAIGVIWIIDRILAVVKINNPKATEVINLIVLLAGVVFIVAPSALEAIK